MKAVIELYYQTQEHRIALGNQMAQDFIAALDEKQAADYLEWLSIKKGKLVKEAVLIPGTVLEYIEDAELDIPLTGRYYLRFHEIEKDLKKDMSKEVKHAMIWIEFLEGVKGIGPVLGLALINTLDPHKAKHRSSFFKYAGLSCDADGNAERRKKGQKLTWNPFLKKVCWLVGQSFIKTGSPYREIYDKEKTKQRPLVQTDGHAHNRAARKMVKHFLGDLWEKWRELEGLPVDGPYVIDVMGHTKQ